MMYEFEMIGDIVGKASGKPVRVADAYHGNSLRFGGRVSPAVADGDVRLKIADLEDR